MPLRKKIDLIDKSTKRLLQTLEMPRDKIWWGFMRREAWVHLKRSIELWWMTVRKKD